MPPTGFFCTGGVPRFAVDPSRSTRLVERLRAHTNEDACRPVDKKRVGVAIVVYQAGLEASGRPNGGGHPHMDESSQHVVQRTSVLVGEGDFGQAQRIASFIYCCADLLLY